ncbi:MAG TPA: preprotein translocase subunit SecE [Acidimicrobiia bacterium]
MNRETRRLMEREERRQKKQQAEGGTARAQAAARLRGTGERKPLVKRFRSFLHEVRVELKKVSWPTREQMTVFTVVTLITSISLTLFTFGLDAGFKQLVLFVIGGIDG